MWPLGGRRIEACVATNQKSRARHMGRVTVPERDEPSTASKALTRTDRLPLVERRWTKLLVPWFLCGLAAIVHVSVLEMVALRFSASWPMLAVLFTPAVVTAWLRPKSRSRSWRWLIVWMLVFSAIPPAHVVNMVVGEGWLFWRTWLLEHDQSPLAEPNARRKGRRRV